MNLIMLIMEESVMGTLLSGVLNEQFEKCRIKANLGLM